MVKAMKIQIRVLAMKCKTKVDTIATKITIKDTTSIMDIKTIIKTVAMVMDIKIMFNIMVNK